MKDKSSVTDLANFGGPPAFSEHLHVGRPNIGDRDILRQRIDQALDRRWLSNNGPMVQELEQRIAAMIGVKHCIAMCNATVGLEIAIRALGLTGEVIVPSFTFVATAHALQWQELTPVFCDIDPRTHNLNPDRVEAMITPRTTGIIGVHLWGRPCAVDELTEIAERRGLHLMYDAAHAFGVSHRGRMVGNFGEVEVFSFHATKFLNALEGGAVVTNDDEIARRVRLMQNFGFQDYDTVLHVGTNGKMNEISAAMCLTSLDCMDDIVDVNRRNYSQYREGVEALPGVSIIHYNDEEQANFQYIVLEVDADETGIHRDDIQRVLWAENILARRYFYPGCHRMEPYRSYFPHAGLLLSETERLSSQVMLLPTGTAVDCDEISRITGIMDFVVANRSEVLRLLTDIPRRELAAPWPLTLQEA